jgi:hypothetical protein
MNTGTWRGRAADLLRIAAAPSATKDVQSTARFAGKEDMRQIFSQRAAGNYVPAPRNISPGTKLDTDVRVGTKCAGQRSNPAWGPAQPALELGMRGEDHNEESEV